MNITKIESFATPLVALVKISTDSGHHGWGQIATFEAADIVAHTLHRQVAHIVLGCDPYEQESINEQVIERNLKFPGSYICRALAAIDTAIWDLKGRIEQKPVWALLGGAGESVPVYGSSMRRDITPQDEAVRMLRLRDEYGYRAFKLRDGCRPPNIAYQWSERHI